MKGRALNQEKKNLDFKPSPGWEYLPEDAPLHHQDTGQAVVRAGAIFIWSNCSWIWWKKTFPGTSAPEQVDLLQGHSCPKCDPGATGRLEPHCASDWKAWKTLLMKQKWIHTFCETHMTLTPVTNSQHQHQKQITCSQYSTNTSPWNRCCYGSPTTQ